MGEEIRTMLEEEAKSLLEYMADLPKDSQEYKAANAELAKIYSNVLEEERLDIECSEKKANCEITKAHNEALIKEAKKDRITKTVTQGTEFALSTFVGVALMGVATMFETSDAATFTLTKSLFKGFADTVSKVRKIF